MDIQKQIVDILAEATGEDFSDNMDQELYESGIMDSMATVQMLLTLQETFDITNSTATTGTPRTSWLNR